MVDQPKNRTIKRGAIDGLGRIAFREAEPRATIARVRDAVGPAADGTQCRGSGNGEYGNTIDRGDFDP